MPHKAKVFRINFAQRTVERLDLPCDGTLAVDKKTRRALTLRRARPVTVNIRSKIPLWPRQEERFLWQYGDGDPLDLHAQKANYQEDKPADLKQEMADIADEYVNEALIRIENPPVNYTIARFTTTAMLATVFAVLLGFAVLFMTTDGFSNITDRLAANASWGILALGSIATRLPPRPQLPSWMQAAWTWVWDAAKIEPRIATGLAIGGAIIGIGSLFTLMMLMVAVQQGVIEVLGALWLGMTISLGFGLPVFIKVSWSKLFLRKMVFDASTGSARQFWVHPRERLGIPPAYLFESDGNFEVWANADGSAFGPRMKPSGLSDEEVYDAHDTADVEEEVRPSRIPWEKINTFLTFGIIALGFFFLMAIWEQMQKAG